MILIQEWTKHKILIYSQDGRIREIYRIMSPTWVDMHKQGTIKQKHKGGGMYKITKVCQSLVRPGMKMAFAA